MNANSEIFYIIHVIGANMHNNMPFPQLFLAFGQIISNCDIAIVEAAIVEVSLISPDFIHSSVSFSVGNAIPKAICANKNKLSCDRTCQLAFFL